MITALATRAPKSAQALTTRLGPLSCQEARVNVQQIDKRLAGHRTNLAIARQNLDFERVQVIAALIDELLDLRTVTNLAKSTG